MIPIENTVSIVTASHLYTVHNQHDKQATNRYHKKDNASLGGLAVVCLNRVLNPGPQDLKQLHAPTQMRPLFDPGSAQGGSIDWGMKIFFKNERVTTHDRSTTEAVTLHMGPPVADTQKKILGYTPDTQHSFLEYTGYTKKIWDAH